MHARPNLLQTSPPYHMYSTHMLVQTLPPPPHAHFVCLLCNRLQMWCWGVRCLYVICLGGYAYTHPRGMLSALIEGAQAWGDGAGGGANGSQPRTSGSTSGQQGLAAWKVRRFDLTWAAQHGEHATVWTGEQGTSIHTHIHTHIYT